MTGQIINLQPSVFNLTNKNLYFDDSRARKEPKDGGLGYKAPFTSLRALCKTGLAFERARKEREVAVNGTTMNLQAPVMGMGVGLLGEGGGK